MEFGHNHLCFKDIGQKMWIFLVISLTTYIIGRTVPVLYGRVRVTEVPTCSLVRKCLWYEGPLMHGPQGSSPSYLDIKVGFLHRNTRFWGPVNSLLWRSFLYIVRCLAACMASTHYIPVAPPSWDKQKYLQTWPNVPWWEKFLMVENHWSKDNIPDKKDPH